MIESSITTSSGYLFGDSSLTFDRLSYSLSANQTIYSSQPTQQKVIITKGIPGSGKSHWADQFVRDQGCFVQSFPCPARTSGVSMIQKDWFYNSNRDNLRKELFGRYDIKGNQEKEVTKVQDKRILEALREGRSVVVSDTNLNEKTVNRLKTLVENYKKDIQEDSSISDTFKEYANNCIIEFKDFTEVPLEVCIKQDLQRERSVGKDVIMEMFHKYIRPTLYKHDSNKKDKPKAVVFDLDGTLALKGDRGVYDWTKVGVDIPNEPVFELLKFYIETGYHIIFCSGRMDCCKEETLGWLDKNIKRVTENTTFGAPCCFSLSPKVWIHAYFENPFKWELFMRKTDDMRKDSIIKKEIFMEHIDQQYNVKIAFDDRPSVCRLWKDLGVFTCSVGQEDHDF